MVDYLNFEGSLRWTLIVLFMLSKAALIIAIFMHLFWERYAIVNALLWPMTLMLLFVWIMAAESEYTLLTRLFYFVIGS
jgi:cytochrome c oxidase subunit IV|tara:strand:- start:1358 stop:1594 length:237 start_codon:yes stop_codon:yes gene_type:complete